MNTLPPVIVCMSGGFDSSILAASHRQRSDIWPLFFDYGQPSRLDEQRAVQSVVEVLGLRPLEVRHLPPIPWTGSPSLPYYPYRNLAFALSALSYAEARAASEVWFGFVADTDPAIFPDATSHFCSTFNAFLQNSYAHRCGVRIDAPLAGRYKRDLVITAVECAFDATITYSCYRSGGRCGGCNACTAILSAFADALVAHPEREDRIRAINPYSALASQHAL